MTTAGPLVNARGVAEATGQARPALATAVRRQSDCKGTRIADQDDQPFSSGHGGVEKVLGQHDEVAGEQNDEDGGILGALDLVDAGGIGQAELVQRVRIVDDLAIIVTSNERSSFGEP